MPEFALCTTGMVDYTRQGVRVFFTLLFCGDRLDLKAQQAERLPETVVEVSGQALTNIILDGDQAARYLSQTIRPGSGSVARRFS